MKHEDYMKERMNMENKVWKAVSPKHYKEVVPGFEYMHMMMYMLKNPYDHLLGQVYKYLMRLGKKDNESQELGKVCLLYTSPSPRDGLLARMQSSA